MRIGLWAAAVLLAATTLNGCATSRSAERFSLEGTNWELVSIQSMDDAQGRTEVEDPSRFTASFAEDGRASFQIDCNRGNGSYEAVPSDDGESGALTFGPIATTMMLCPQPSLDQRVSLALSNVRGYVYQDERLNMSQVADGDVLSWRRAASEGPTP